MAEKRFNPNPQQREAIEKDYGHTIVSAAAGSGKTTVLAQRVLRRIADGMTSERMLIVTFTVAAAAEMRTRICRVLRERYEETEDEHLWDETFRIQQAQISTIDSYQAKIVRENFQTLGISPNFTMLDSVEQSVLEMRVLHDMMEEYYETFPGDFRDLLWMFGGDGENEKLEEAIYNLYSYLKSVPFAEAWLEEKKALYQGDERAWLHAFCAEYRPLFEELAYGYTRALEDGGATLKPDHREVAKKELSYIKSIHKAFCEENYKTLCSLRGTLSKEKIVIRASDEETVRFKQYREQLFKLIEAPLFQRDLLEMLPKDLAFLRKGICAFFTAVSDYAERIKAAFREQNKYSFDEISSLALKLIVERYYREDGMYVLTPVGQALGEAFDEIMIDEYQDVNDRQDLFFRALSRNNLFIVGDVKQSIYGFRHANPDNFLQKMDEFHLIGLTENFRSSKAILHFVNLIFERLFTKAVGGLEYGASERLVYHEPSEEPAPMTKDVELDLILVKGRSRTVEWEARATARRIRALIQSGMKVRGEEGERPVRYSDVAVLMRKRSGHFDVYQKIFAEEGVPLFAETGRSFFDTVEVNTVLAVLSVLDNPYKDISLFTLLTSPLFAFTSEEIANIRLCKRTGRLFGALSAYAKEHEKTRQFLEELGHLKLLAANLPLHRFIWHLYIEKHYLAFVSAGDLGGEKRENLMKLYHFAKRYEGIGKGSLADFLDFVEKARTGNDAGTESASPQGEFVRMMTFHGSKGMEYPICFVTQLNDAPSPERRVVLTDDLLGVGTKLRYEVTRERTTAMREIVAMRRKKKELAERSRLLYVAFTRAKEKLFLVSAYSQNKMDKFAEIAAIEKGPLGELWQRSAYTDMDLLLYAMARHGCFDVYHDFEVDNTSPLRLCTMTVEDVEGGVAKKKEERSISCGLSAEEIKRRFSFVYPHILNKVPAGISATELAKHMDAPPESLRLIEEAPRIEPPAFVTDAPLSGMQRGTLIHRFCEKADMEKDLHSELERLVCDGVFTKEEATALDLSKIRAFAESDLYRRLKTAKRIHREESFLTFAPASLYDAAAKEGSLLLRGMMDAVYEWEDGLIILDYKSDGCSLETLRERYETQLRIYRYAAEKIYGKKVLGVYLWSFKHSTELAL